jgi:hypothetical protein
MAFCSLLAMTTQKQRSLLLDIYLLDIRGPAKGYIEALENRLLETERILLQLLPTVSSEHLSSTCFTADQSPSYSNGRSLPSTSTFPKKGGIDYWTSYPLTSVNDVRRWQEDRFRDCEAKVDDGNKGQDLNLGQQMLGHRILSMQMQPTSPQHPPRGYSFSQHLEQMPPQPRVFDSNPGGNNIGTWSHGQKRSMASLVDPETKAEGSTVSDTGRTHSSSPKEGIIPANFKREFIW